MYDTYKNRLHKLNFPRKYKKGELKCAFTQFSFSFSFLLLWTEKYMEGIHLAGSLEKQI